MIVSIPRRLLPLAVLSLLLLLILSFRHFQPTNPWSSLRLEKVGLEEALEHEGVTIITPGENSPFAEAARPSAAIVNSATPSPNIELGKQPDTTKFKPGTVKPAGSNYTKMLVTPRTKKEKDMTKWIPETFIPGNGVNVSMYVADDPWAPLHPPKNKGHEVMIYLTYIIDHYDSLADVNIFMHSHQFAWHNDDLLDQNAALMIQRLSSERVQREGYVNLRCHWHPGCPDWMHPGATEVDINKQEEVLLAKSWSELFPMDEIPDVLAQPCCAQFAISKDRIRQLPLSRYVFFRDWLLRTPLSDALSGRVWEYVWHYLFTGQNVVCPKEHICYCDGFGVCFGGQKQYDQYWAAVNDMNHLKDKLVEWKRQDSKIKEMEAKGQIQEGVEVDVPEYGLDKEMEKKIEELEQWTKATKQQALHNGDDPEFRAIECGRVWQEGDGF